MKYKDNHLQITSDFISVVDKDRPVQALIDLFNPANNPLSAQSQSLIIRVTGILHEMQQEVSFGIADTRLHTVLPIVIYSRESNQDTYFSLSNNLVIQDHQLARDLLEGAQITFYKEPKPLIDAVFNINHFVYLVLSITEEEAIFTAIDKIIDRRGIISLHNPEYKNTTSIMKYCLDRDVMLIENIDGSADLIRI